MDLCFQKDPAECWLTCFNCPKCTFFFLILEDRDLFQILGLTGSCIGGAKLANFSITRGFLLYLVLAPSKCFTSRRGLAVLDY